MKTALAFCLIAFPTLMNAGIIEILSPREKKLNTPLLHFLKTNEEEGIAFPIIAKVTNIENWRKLSVTRLGCEIVNKEDESWIVTASVTREQLMNILDQSFVLYVSGETYVGAI